MALRLECGRDARRLAAQCASRGAEQSRAIPSNTGQYRANARQIRSANNHQAQSIGWRDKTGQRAIEIANL